MPDNSLVVESNLSRIGMEDNLEQASVRGKDRAITAESPVQDITMASSVKAQDALQNILRFLSTASNETLGACLAALGAVTYFILGRVGLVLIGVVGGVALHATWEERNGQCGSQAESAEVKARKRREDALSILHRVLDWRAGYNSNQLKVNGDISATGIKSLDPKQLDFSEFEPATGAALTGLTDAVIRDYVKYTLLNLSVELD